MVIEVNVTCGRHSSIAQPFFSVAGHFHFFGAAGAIQEPLSRHTKEELLSAIEKASNATELAAAVRTELTRQTDPTLKWQCDDEFRRGWLSRPMYVTSRPDRSNMLLNALEQNIRTNRNEAVVFGGSLTVEHYVPQKGALSDHPFPEPMPKYAMDGNDTLESCRARLIHTMGNLTLLTHELNSSVSNGPFPAKSQAIASDSDLRLNVWLRGGPVATWSETDILRRGEELFESARTVWSFPGRGG